jgi:protein arginine N-methyltransferase 7
MMAEFMLLSLGNHICILILLRTIKAFISFQITTFLYVRWVLQLDREGTIYYSTAPRWIRSSTTTSEDFEWCDHWKQCVWFVPGSGISIFKGGEINLHATHDDISISYNLNTQVSTTEILPDGLTTGDFQLLIPPERAAIYGDEGWRLSMLKAIKSVVSYYSLHLMT